MKIEFVKETNIRGDVYYYTTVNGLYETNSLSSDYSFAYEFFIAMRKRKEPIVEVLEHYIIEEPKPEINELN
ncbi:hypothetical protein UFOVP614_23 [uncultured Caudovirales phage]|uniref:Uncharacterized protein n=1 Tax=uncultured Caudovirales phage TaxID=2100421 RepID=A0A6J5NAL4_9CAUD|nr:hypothetical protein UFOVP614_23 [uncultured Caudovirales phage]